MIGFILGVLLLIIGFFLIVAITDAKYPFYTVSVYFFMMIGVWLIFKYNKPEPTALDVYRNKTTLEVTYKDGVPIDSVVVFKNK